MGQTSIDFPEKCILPKQAISGQIGVLPLITTNITFSSQQQKKQPFLFD